VPQSASCWCWKWSEGTRPFIIWKKSMSNLTNEQWKKMTIYLSTTWIEGIVSCRQTRLHAIQSYCHCSIGPIWCREILSTRQFSDLVRIVKLGNHLTIVNIIILPIPCRCKKNLTIISTLLISLFKRLGCSFPRLKMGLVWQIVIGFASKTCVSSLQSPDKPLQRWEKPFVKDV